MPEKLSPKAAARLAAAAYTPYLFSQGGGKEILQKAGVINGVLTITPQLNNKKLTLLNGATGLGGQSPFGFVAHADSGPWSGDTFVCIRGTKNGADWLSNFRAGCEAGRSGHPVHIGFNSLAQSILPQVRKALQNRNPNRIHVVGHSLGGAAATLVADALQGVGSINLYTFGAPRVGMQPYSAYLTHALGAKSIFRAFHDTDVVPMLPLFPFTHVPNSDLEYMLKGHGQILSIHTHYMPQYESSVDMQSWKNLTTLSHRRFSLDTVDDVLVQAGAITGGFLNTALLRLLLHGLKLILRGARMSIGTQMVAGMTVVDTLAMAMYSLARTGARMADQVRGIIMQIARFLGIAINASGQISLALLKWIVDRLMRTLLTKAAIAIAHLN